MHRLPSAGQERQGGGERPLPAMRSEQIPATADLNAVAKKLRHRGPDRLKKFPVLPDGNYAPNAPRNGCLLGAVCRRKFAKSRKIPVFWIGTTETRSLQTGSCAKI